MIIKELNMVLLTSLMTPRELTVPQAMEYHTSCLSPMLEIDVL